jgi:nucleoside-diphosphate-sugar epimerase
LSYIIFGGAGFIASHLIKLARPGLAKDDRIYALDIETPRSEARVEGVEYLFCDVRDPIPSVVLEAAPDDIVFNLAAVHRTPGHKDIEYFETNIRGAENVTRFAAQHGVRRILFTSSIAVYGPGEDLKTEASLPAPSSAYGASKLAAEKIHEIWQAGGEGRRLVTLRPGVVFGKGERGNFSRMHKGIKGGYFFYPGRKDTIKACIYVKDLAAFMMREIAGSDEPGAFLYNCTYSPPPTVEAISEAFKSAEGLKGKIPVMPSWLLKSAAAAAAPLLGKPLGIHPDRVAKLMVSTNISGEKMAMSGHKPGFAIDGALRDWLGECAGGVAE